MQDEILPITCAPLPYGLDDKIFYQRDDDGNVLWGPYSYNDYIKFLEIMSGVNPELLGEK